MYERYSIEFDWYFGIRYEVQEMVNGLSNLRNAIRDAEEIVYGEMNFI